MKKHKTLEQLELKIERLEIELRNKERDLEVVNYAKDMKHESQTKEQLEVWDSYTTRHVPMEVLMDFIVATWSRDEFIPELKEAYTEMEKMYAGQEDGIYDI